MGANGRLDEDSVAVPEIGRRGIVDVVDDPRATRRNVLDTSRDEGADRPANLNRAAQFAAGRRGGRQI